jgi:hypothetical protein
MSVYHIHYELLPVDHPYNRCDIRQLQPPLDRETFLMRLLPQTLWGTLYIEVAGKMLFQRHWRYRQKEPFDQLPSAGFTCELLELAQVFSSNYEDILSGERGIRPVELIGYDVRLWFRRSGPAVQLYFDERPAFSNVFEWQPIPIETFVSETHCFLTSLWQDVARLNPRLESDPLIQEQILAVNQVKERFEQGAFSKDIYVEEDLSFPAVRG